LQQRSIASSKRDEFRLGRLSEGWGAATAPTRTLNG